MEKNGPFERRAKPFLTDAWFGKAIVDPVSNACFEQEKNEMSNAYGLLLTRDLMFTSKITSTAAALGFQVEVVATAEQLRLRSLQIPPQAVFLDLNCPDVDPLQIISFFSLVERPRIIAFGAHVDEDRLRTARQAGCDEVLPRSKFSASLPAVLQQSFQRSE